MTHKSSNRWLVYLLVKLSKYWVTTKLQTSFKDVLRPKLLVAKFSYLLSYHKITDFVYKMYLASICKTIWTNVFHLNPKITFKTLIFQKWLPPWRLSRQWTWSWRSRSETCCPWPTRMWSELEGRPGESFRQLNRRRRTRHRKKNSKWSEPTGTRYVFQGISCNTVKSQHQGGLQGFNVFKRDKLRQLVSVSTPKYYKRLLWYRFAPRVGFLANAF